MQTTKDRLLEFLKQIEISQAKFAERVGVSRNYVNSMVDNITQNTVEKIQAAYPDLNIDWLTKGQGEMLRTPTADTAANTPQKALPLIPFEAIAGYLSTDNEGVRLEDCERYVIPEFDRRGAEFIIRVSGSSMYPKYSNGDLLGCKKIENILFFQWGKIYVLDTSQGTLVKRVYEHENDDFVMLVSDNKAVYPPFAIPKSDIRSLSIVVGVVRLE
jgi:transcriptional regulator with XRE-family HTH domain